MTLMQADAGAEEDSFEAVLARAHDLKEKILDKRLKWYKWHANGPFWLFRGSGTLVVVLSVALPVVASADFHGLWRLSKENILTCMSLSIALLTALASFWGWDRTWAERKTAQTGLENIEAKWELEIEVARHIAPRDEKKKVVYKATNALLHDYHILVMAHADSFFSRLRFPQSTAKETTGHT